MTVWIPKVLVKGLQQNASKHYTVPLTEIPASRNPSTSSLPAMYIFMSLNLNFLTRFNCHQFLTVSVETVLLYTSVIYTKVHFLCIVFLVTSQNGN